MEIDDCGIPTESRIPRHNLGNFTIPEDAQIKGINLPAGETPYPWTGTYGVGNREHFQIRANVLGE